MIPVNLRQAAHLPNMYEDESLWELLGRLEDSRHSLGTGFSLLDDLGVTPGQFVELVGPSQTGKTEFLYHLLPWLVLGSRSSSEGVVVLVDLDGRFSIPRMIQIMDIRRIPKHTQQMILSRILYIHASSYLQLLACLFQLEQDHHGRPLLALLIDHVSAFHSQQRANSAYDTERQGTHRKHDEQLYKLITRITRSQRLFTFLTCISAHHSLLSPDHSLCFAESDSGELTVSTAAQTILFDEFVQRSHVEQVLEEFSSCFAGVGQLIRVIAPLHHVLPDAVLVLVFSSTMKHVLFVRHHERGWEVPGGKVDDEVDQDVVDAAIREVLEEAGVSMDREWGFERVYDYKIVQGSEEMDEEHHKAVVTVRVPENVSISETVKLTHETDETRWVPVSQLDPSTITSNLSPLSPILQDRVFPIVLSRALEILLQ